MKSKVNNADHFLSREFIIWDFSASHDPVLRVSSGETILVQTRDCYNYAIQTEADLIKTIPSSEVNPATGPIFIEGAMPGDTLAVTLISIETGPRGAARLYPGEGQLHDLVKAPYGRFFDVADGVVRMNEKVTFPASPMIGVIGVAPESGSISTMPAGMHGGNLDDNMNKAGSIVYLPVKHEGALLALGDMHASMGDGEICGTGIEIDGEVLIKVEVIKSVGTSYPVTQTADSWITHGVAFEDLTLAMKIACEEAAGLLVDQWGFTYEDAFIFLSVAADLGIAQSVHPSSGTVIAKMSVPSISACPTPFNI
ncbi:unannotated protein [freshwater metagenome]|uniref:Unannotated protein n=1 Tax=freshwater metagenome TaxID=449393 RepID=A0A6J7XXQ9_9ZZZZ|nr:hypothetical protein [Actinomycetota bacterium]